MWSFLYILRGWTANAAGQRSREMRMIMNQHICEATSPWLFPLVRSLLRCLFALALFLPDTNTFPPRTGLRRSHRAGCPYRTSWYGQRDGAKSPAPQVCSFRSAGHRGRIGSSPSPWRLMPCACGRRTSITRCMTFRSRAFTFPGGIMAPDWLSSPC